MSDDYDPADDARKCYEVAIAAKKARGDKHYPIPFSQQPWKRKEVIGDCTIYLGDCRAILPILGKVDAVVTDPPYGIGADKDMHKKSGKQYGKAAAPNRHYRDTEWDIKPIPSDLMDLVRQAGRWQIIFGGNYYSFPASSCWLVWDKENGGTGFADCELAWTNLPKAVRRIRWMWNGMLRKGGEEREGHPTQKPVGVMEWAINQLPTPNQSILDPFMGSGTTGIAALKLGRKFIGIEIDEQYFDLACARILKAYAQPDFFVEQAKPDEPKQTDIFGEAAE